MPIPQWTMEINNSETNEDEETQQLKTAKRAERHFLHWEWINEFTWLHFDKSNAMHCAFWKQCSPAVAGKRLFAILTTKFKHESLLLCYNSLTAWSTKFAGTSVSTKLQLCFRHQEVVNWSQEEADLNIW